MSIEAYLQREEMLDFREKLLDDEINISTVLRGDMLLCLLYFISILLA